MGGSETSRVVEAVVATEDWTTDAETGDTELTRDVGTELEGLETTVIDGADADEDEAIADVATVVADDDVERGMKSQ